MKMQPKSLKANLVSVAPALVASLSLVHSVNALESETATHAFTNPLANALIAQDTNSPAAPITGVYGNDGLRMNFQGAPLNLVLDYLSEAAGFVINKQTQVQGNVEVWSKQPVTKNEAVDLLNSVLKKNGYAVTRSGRILTIVSLEAVKTADTEIVVNSDPGQVEKSDEVQTQIIPVRYASASQLVANLQQLLTTSATLSANESANTLILVATKTDIKRMLKIITALDTSMASAATIKVRPLRYGDAKEIANLVTQLFAQQNSSQTAQATQGNGPNFGGGPPGFFPGMGGGNQATPASSGSSRGSAAVKITAVADDRSNSVIVSAPAQQLPSIEDMIEKLDQQATELSELRVFHLHNADPSEIADQVAQLFPDPASSNSSQNGNGMPVFFPGRGPSTGNTSSTADSSNRMKKLGKVAAIADPRTSSVIVTASKTAMSSIAELITALDSSEGKREMVGYFELQHADPHDIYQNLTDLFNRSNVRQNNGSQNTLLGQNNPLAQRQTQNQQSSSTGLSTGFGNASQGTAGRGTP